MDGAEFQKKLKDINTEISRIDRYIRTGPADVVSALRALEVQKKRLADLKAQVPNLN